MRSAKPGYDTTMRSAAFKAVLQSWGVWGGRGAARDAAKAVAGSRHTGSRPALGFMLAAAVHVAHTKCSKH